MTETKKNKKRKPKYKKENASKKQPNLQQKLRELQAHINSNYHND